MNTHENERHLEEHSKTFYLLGVVNLTALLYITNVLTCFTAAL